MIAVNPRIQDPDTSQNIAPERSAGLFSFMVLAKTQTFIDAPSDC
jgi:hypothetical protein